MNEFKKKLLLHCKQILKNKIAELSSTLADLKSSMENETKSSVGDKHETARAKMQTEEEGIQKQLSEFRQQLSELEKVGPENKNPSIGFGSFFKTDHGLFFLSVPIGKIRVEDKDVFVITPVSPLGKLFIGKQKNDKVQMRELEYKIEELF